MKTLNGKMEVEKKCCILICGKFQLFHVQYKHKLKMEYQQMSAAFVAFR